MVLAMVRQLSPASRRLRASPRWWSLSFGLRPNRVPLALAALRPSLARLRIRPRSSSAIADKKAMKPRPSGVVRSRCGGQRWLATAERCRTLRPDGLTADEPLPFDLKLAHELYDQLLKPFVYLTKGKSLIIVPSGPLTSLPFQVLVAEAPTTAKDSAKVSDLQGLTPDYRSAQWLALRQPITVLPSVGSLQAYAHSHHKSMERQPS